MAAVSTETQIAKEWVGKVAIVTGASAGIGLDLIRVLASNGVKAIGCARNISKIEEAGLSLNGIYSLWCNGRLKSMLDVNVLGVCICTREFFQHHNARKADLGYIINVSSIVGHIIPHASTLHFYSTSKFAVTTITEGTRHELREIKSNIKISQISPGVVYTEFVERQLKDKAKADAFYNQSFKENSCLEAILFLLSTPPRVCCHEIIIRGMQQSL